MEKSYKSFDENTFYGYLVKAQLKNAINYLKQFEKQAELYQKYVDLFCCEKYFTYDAEELINDILLIYQKYFRDVFYLELNTKQAEETMKRRFLELFKINDARIEMSEIEQQIIAKEFNKKSYRFLGGRTGGYFGPYIWNTDETKRYKVELPNGNRQYTVKLLDGFIFSSWCYYISFGAIGTGGWVDNDGIINCIKSSYDLEDESFTVSLLKHEAQHANDLANYKNISSEDLEYRAKLVELIYSSKRNLISQFAYEADSLKDKNVHSLAASRILEGFKNKTPKSINSLSIPEIQSISYELFKESNEEIKAKYLN